MAHTTHTTLFLARCKDWTHADGTAPVRVHLQLTATDENGGFWAIRGTTRHDNRRQGEAVFVKRDSLNKLIRDTTFVTTKEGLVYLTQADVIRATGRIDEDSFSKIWDQIEAR